MDSQRVIIFSLDEATPSIKKISEGKSELVAASMNKTVELTVSKPTSSGGVQTFLKHMQLFQSFFL